MFLLSGLINTQVEDDFACACTQFDDVYDFFFNIYYFARYGVELIRYGVDFVCYGVEVFFVYYCMYGLCWRLTC